MGDDQGKSDETAAPARPSLEDAALIRDPKIALDDGLFEMLEQRNILTKVSGYYYCGGEARRGEARQGERRY